MSIQQWIKFLSRKFVFDFIDLGLPPVPDTYYLKHPTLKFDINHDGNLMEFKELISTHELTSQYEGRCLWMVPIEQYHQKTIDLYALRTTQRPCERTLDWQKIIPFSQLSFHFKYILWRQGKHYLHVNDLNGTIRHI